MPEINIEYESDFFRREKDIKEFWESNKAVIEQMVSNVDQKLGDGNTSEVFFLGKNKNLCVKILKKTYDGTYRVPFAKEMKFLEDVYGIDSEVKTPKPYLIAEHTDGETEVKFILMERINAVSIRDIIEKNGKFPDNFNVEDFRKKMLNFIDMMHNRNIHHRDLHDGNIMLGEDGQIYVIDFGRSGVSFGDENPYSIRYEGQTISFPSDTDNLRQICLSLRNHVLTK
jgi:serine/threonine protein kinase